MKAKQLLTVLLLFAAFTGLNAQTDIYGLKVYGFFQTSFRQSDFKLSIPMYMPDINNKSNSFWLQQMNIFLSKDINENFRTFVDLELTNAFSSDKNWGAFNVEEAWVNYSHNDAFNIKGGMLIPRFNNMNEIKNRTILLPYIFRPFVYETAVKNILSNAVFVPQRANVEVYGRFSLGNIALDYNVYAGNSEDSYIVTNVGQMSVSGTDSTKFKLFGGRIGLKYDNLKIGVSMSSDKSNQSTYKIGDVGRTRLGADLSFSAAGFNLEAEYIAVSHDLNDTKKNTLKFISTINPLVTDNLDKKFYYANLTYNLNDSWYMYVKYDYLEDKSVASLSEGMNGYSVGGGFRPTDDIVLKAQYQAMRGENGKIFKLNLDDFHIGASVFF